MGRRPQPRPGKLEWVPRRWEAPDTARYITVIGSAADEQAVTRAEHLTDALALPICKNSVLV